MFARSFCWSLSGARRIQSIPPHLISLTWTSVHEKIISDVFISQFRIPRGEASWVVYDQSTSADIFQGFFFNEMSWQFIFLGNPFIVRLTINLEASVSKCTLYFSVAFLLTCSLLSHLQERSVRRDINQIFKPFCRMFFKSDCNKSNRNLFQDQVQVVTLCDPMKIYRHLKLFRVCLSLETEPTRSPKKFVKFCRTVWCKVPEVWELQIQRNHIGF